MADWRDEIIKFCEEIEDEEGGEQGFRRGRRYTAKQIRNFVGEIVRETDAPIVGTFKLACGHVVDREKGDG